MPVKTSNDTKNSALAPIVRGTIYPLPVFQQITGLGKHALRTARRRGLRVRTIGGRRFVFADDFFVYAEQLESQESAER
jgi:hypothetical protein